MISTWSGFVNNYPKYALFMLLAIASVAWPSVAGAERHWSYNWFQIEDTRHNLSIVGGDVFDGHIYHQASSDSKDKPRNNAQWKFVKTDDGYYQIFDRLSQKAIVAGDVFDGQVYHQEPGNRLNAEWKLVPWQGHPDQFLIMNRKWRDYGIVAGDFADNHLYLQIPGDRANAIWTLRLKEAGDLGPKQFVTAEVVLDVKIDLDGGTRIAQAPQEFEQLFQNSSSRDVEKEIDFTRERASTFQATYETWVTASTATSLAESFGVKVDGLSAGTQVKLESKLEEGSRSARTSTGSVTMRVDDKTTYTIPAGKTVRFRQTILSDKIDAPFTIVVRQTLGDGTQHDVTRTGRLTGVMYTLAKAQVGED